jgi:hypothetical protein
LDFVSSHFLVWILVVVILFFWTGLDWTGTFAECCDTLRTFGISNQCLPLDPSGRTVRLEFHQEFLAGRQALEQQHSVGMGRATPSLDTNNYKSGSPYYTSNSNHNHNQWEDQPLPLKRSDVVPIDDDDDDDDEEGLSEDAFASFLSNIQFATGGENGSFLSSIQSASGGEYGNTTTATSDIESMDHDDMGVVSTTIAVIPMDHDSDGDHVIDSPQEEVVVVVVAANEKEQQQDTGHQPQPPPHQQQQQKSSEQKNPNHGPGRFDVLLGVRGKASLQHPGNSRYCHIIGMHCQAYEAAAKYQKLEIADRVIEAIRESGGRFLKPVTTSTNTTATMTSERPLGRGGRGGAGDDWEEMEDEIVLREKVAHAFRNLRRRKRQLQQEGQR